MALMEVRGLTKRFGGLIAVNDVTFDVEKGDLKGLIGPNGAGKTVLFNCITGVYTPEQGNVLFDGEDFTPLPRYERARKGLVRTWQVIRPLARLTVAENVEAAHAWSIGIRDSYDIVRRNAQEAMKAVGIDHIRDNVSGTIPLGDLKRLELARAIVNRPKMLMLDEPFAGSSPEETQILIQLIKKLRDDLGMTFLVVSHRLRELMGLVESLVVINLGSKIAEGTPQEIAVNESVIDAYLGRRQQYV